MRSTVLVLTALLLLGSSAVSADDTKKPKNNTPAEKTKTDSSSTAPKGGDDEDLTFTTEDLEDRYGKSARTTPKKPAKPGATKAVPKRSSGKPAQSPLEIMEAQKKASREKAAQRAEAERRVQTAQARVTELTGRLARLRNPLLGRAQSGDESDQAWKGADQAQRLKMTEERLAAARAELTQAEKERADLR